MSSSSEPLSSTSRRRLVWGLAIEVGGVFKGSRRALKISLLLLEGQQMTSNVAGCMDRGPYSLNATQLVQANILHTMYEKEWTR